MIHSNSPDAFNSPDHAGAPEHSQPSPKQPNAPLVLVVDDQKTPRLMLLHLMASEGYRVLEASHGEECLAMCQEQQPDLILLDAVMPVMDGFTCCIQLQMRYGQHCPPVLMITTLDDQDSVDQAFAAGAVDYVTKPIHWAILRQRVKQLLRYRLTQEQVPQPRLQQMGQPGALQLDPVKAPINAPMLLPNREALEWGLQQEWRRLLREQLFLALILCAIDGAGAHQSAGNVLFLPKATDQILPILQQCAQRPADLIAQYDRAEFAILLPHTQIQGAVYVAEQIQDQLRQQAIAHHGCSRDFNVTLSFGIASMVPALTTTSSALITAADKAKHQAQRAGGDRIVCGYLKTPPKPSGSLGFFPPLI